MSSGIPTGHSSHLRVRGGQSVVVLERVFRVILSLELGQFGKLLGSVDLLKGLISTRVVDIDGDASIAGGRTDIFA